MPQSGITISVTAETNSGGRRYMEDYLAVRLSPNDAIKQIPDLREQAYFAVFDGHGGKEAAKFAREKLWDTIQNQPEYTSRETDRVCDSIRDGFLALHNEMLALRAGWKPYKKGGLSTAGTTASAVIFRQDRIFVANVGDSTAVLAVRNPRAQQTGEPAVVAQVLTKDHKPDDPEETRLIESLGGRVMLSKKGVSRVVWERQRSSDSDSSDAVDLIPFLSVSRSLGDFWSYSVKSDKYAVSPLPDVKVVPLDLSQQKFVVIASDGLWNVMSPDEVVRFVWDYENDSQSCHEPRDVVRALINEALVRWKGKYLFADNISVLIAFLSEGSGKVSTLGSGVRGSVAPASTSNDPQVVPSSSIPEVGQEIGPCDTTTIQTDNSVFGQESLGGVEFENCVKIRRKRARKVPKHLSLSPQQAPTEDSTLCRSPLKRECCGDDDQTPEDTKKPRLEPSLLQFKRLLSDSGHGSDTSSGIFSDESRSSPDCIIDPATALCADTEFVSSSAEVE